MRKKYDTDLTDEQWNEIAPLFNGMRKYKWEKRELLDAVFYLVDSGCKWRQLSHDFPPAFTVHSFYRRARLSGLWDKILEHMVRLTRKNAGLDENPTVALVDSQTTGNSFMRRYKNFVLMEAIEKLLSLKLKNTWVWK